MRQWIRKLRNCKTVYSALVVSVLTTNRGSCSPTGLEKKEEKQTDFLSKQFTCSHDASRIKPYSFRPCRSFPVPISQLRSYIQFLSRNDQLTQQFEVTFVRLIHTMRITNKLGHSTLICSRLRTPKSNWHGITALQGLLVPLMKRLFAPRCFSHVCWQYSL